MCMIVAHFLNIYKGKRNCREKTQFHCQFTHHKSSLDWNYPLRWEAGSNLRHMAHDLCGGSVRLLYCPCSQLHGDLVTPVTMKAIFMRSRSVEKLTTMYQLHRLFSMGGINSIRASGSSSKASDLNSRGAWFKSRWRYWQNSRGFYQLFWEHFWFDISNYAKNASLLV